MDLNELPPDFDYDFLDCSEANPSYCTQAVEASGQGAVHDIVQFADEQDVPALDSIEAAVGCCNLDENPEDVQTIADNTQGVAGLEEIWSTPPVPYTGQIFSSKQEAREFYNSYASRIGFSIRTSTSRLSGLTREQHKILFVCNKEGHGRKVKEGNPGDESDDSDDGGGGTGTENNNKGNGEEDAEKIKKLDGGKKTKRERMHHTYCKPRMVVKLIADRWHVIFFAPDHNHDLVVKPSMKKFRRSHKGYP